VIETSRRGRIAIARMAHGKANAFDTELSTALTSLIAAFSASADAALVLTGQGAIFSAGVDLVRVVEEGESYIRTFLPALSGALMAVFACPKPVVAAVNGHAIAGGCILACAADYRVMSAGPGRIGIPELRVGVPFPVVPLEIMRFAAPGRVQSLVYHGATFAAAEAVREGMIDAVAEAGGLTDAAVSAAESLAGLPAPVFAMTKRQVRGPAIDRMNSGESLDREAIARWSEPETIAQVRAYIETTFKRRASRMP